MLPTSDHSIHYLLHIMFSRYVLPIRKRSNSKIRIVTLECRSKVNGTD